MAAGPYDIIFGGVILKGRQPEEVKKNIGRLFQADDKRVERLFSGKPIMIKAGVDRQTAAKYQAMFKKAGAVCRIRQNNRDAETNQAASTNQTTLTNQTASTNQLSSSDASINLTIAPVGADVTDPVQEQQHNVPDISSITVAELGTDVLEFSEELVVKNIDTSSITVAEVGTDILDEVENNYPEPPDTDFIELLPPGADLSEDDGREPPPFPDVSNITLADQNTE